MEVIVRIIRVQASNFASYKEIDFDLSGQGLILIHGATGSGKSTLCDLVPWILFGTTAKNGSVDEVLSWPGDVVTEGRAVLDLGDTSLWITRTRGKGKNDLSFIIDGVWENPKRGKDLQDTQKLINNLLGIDANLYLSGAYFHEFSTVASFFITTAKNRRLICEQIVDLTLAKKLQLKLSENKKIIDKSMGQIEGQIMTLTSNLALLEKLYKIQKNVTEDWEASKAFKKKELEDKYDNFEKQKNQALDTYREAEAEYLKNAIVDVRCGECGTILTAKHDHKPYNPFKSKIEAVLARENIYLEQLVDLERQSSPYSNNLGSMLNEILEKDAEKFALEANLEKLNSQASDLDTLEQVKDYYRSTIIQNAIQDIEITTNSRLSDYFDGEIQISLMTEESDKIEVSITKDGNQCSYTQLSKGQRQLLKLCFGISVMKAVSNHSGVSFNGVFLDEALDGLDDNLKVKAYRLLESLALDYESVFVVEHNSALKEMFPNKLKAQLVNGHSEINEE